MAIGTYPITRVNANTYLIKGNNIERDIINSRIPKSNCFKIVTLVESVAASKILHSVAQKDNILNFFDFIFKRLKFINIYPIYKPNNSLESIYGILFKGNTEKNEKYILGLYESINLIDNNAIEINENKLNELYGKD